VFWSASLNDVLAAIAGWNEAQGGGNARPAPVTRDELNDLIAHRKKLDRKAQNGN
jgi:hypothetical protein